MKNIMDKCVNAQFAIGVTGTMPKHETYENLVIQSYGVKSEDGERFSKRVGERRYGAGEDFVESMAYDALYMEMLSDVKNLINFVRAIIPEEINGDLNNNPEFQANLKEIDALQKAPTE